MDFATHPSLKTMQLCLDKLVTRWSRSWADSTFSWHFHILISELHQEESGDLTQWWCVCLVEEQNQSSDPMLRKDLLDWFTCHGLDSPTMAVFTLERLRTSSSLVHMAGCFNSLNLALKSWGFLERLWFSVHIGRLKSLHSVVSREWPAVATE